MATGKQINWFFQEGMWTIDEQSMRPARRWGLILLRRLVITIKLFIQNNLTSYAAALTYNCLLAFVPVLSIIYALAQGFGWGEEIEQRLRDNLYANSDDVLSTEVFNFVHSYIEHTHSGVFLGVGLLLLIFTVNNLSSSIETVFNTIWHVRTSRNVYRRMMDYTAIFVLFPTLVVVTSGFSVFLMTIAGQYSSYLAISSTMTFIMRYTPLFLSSLCFIALFKFMPNTSVHWHSVLIPGILAGILFQLLQYYYFQYQIKLSAYNAIYGSFAALPLFMLWLQLSWYVCLAGGQLSYAIQHGDEYLFARDSRNLTRQDHDTLCLYLMTRVCDRFRKGEQPYTHQSMANETRLPLTLVRGLMDELTEAGLLAEMFNYSTSDTESAYHPALDISRITPNYVIRQLDNRGKGRLAYNWTKGNLLWKNLNRMRQQMLLTDGDMPLTSKET